MYSEDEFMVWEMEQCEMEGERWCPKKTRRAFDPKQERLIKRRKRGSRFGRWDKELPSYKAIQKNKVRTQYRILGIEDDLHPLPKEYWTRGWLTW